MKRAVVTPDAELDLVELFNYVASDNPDAARKLIARLRRAFRDLARIPKMGHLREELSDEPLRFWPIGAYLIIYRSEPAPIQILRIVHSARDVQALLKK